MNKLIIVGAGGAGVEALWVARRINACAPSTVWEIVGFLDDNPSLAGSVLEGVPILGSVTQYAKEQLQTPCYFHVGIGDNRVRERVTQLLEKAGLTPATLIDPSAVISETARVGEGSYVAPHVFIGPRAIVGRYALINTGASVGHDGVVHEYAQLCPGGRLSGGAVLGRGGFVGSNGVLAPGIAIGDWARVGAASFAARDVPTGATALGVPAKVLAVPPVATLKRELE